MKLKSDWKKYFGTADEREEAESNRISRRAFYLMTALLLVVAYYLLQMNQIALVHNLDPTPYAGYGTISFVLCLIIIVCCLYSAFAQTNKGIMGSPAFSSADTFPVSFGIVLSALSAGAVALMLVVCRCVAEMSMVGAVQTYWLGNLAIGALMFAVLFVCIFAALWVYFKSAKKKQAKLLAELED